MPFDDVSKARDSDLPQVVASIEIEVNLQQRAREQQHQNINEAIMPMMVPSART